MGKKRRKLDRMYWKLLIFSCRNNFSNLINIIFIVTPSTGCPRFENSMPLTHVVLLFCFVFWDDKINFVVLCAHDVYTNVGRVMGTVIGDFCGFFFPEMDFVMHSLLRIYRQRCAGYASKTRKCARTMITLIYWFLTYEIKIRMKSR